MGKIIAVGNEKGGVGKTSTVINLGLGLVRRNKGVKVLMVDFDPQGDTARVAGKAMDVQEQNIGKFLLKMQKPGDAIISAIRKGYEHREGAYIMPSSGYLSKAKYFLIKQAGLQAEMEGGGETAITIATKQIHSLIKPLATFFDYVIIDCPPSLDELQFPIYSLAQHLIVPARCTAQSVAAVGSQTTSVREANKANGGNLRMSIILPTMYKEGQLVSDKALEKLQGNYGRAVSDPIPSSVVVEKAALMGVSAWEFDPKSKPALAYEKVIKLVEALS